MAPETQPVPKMCGWALLYSPKIASVLFHFSVAFLLFWRSHSYLATPSNVNDCSLPIRHRLGIGKRRLAFGRSGSMASTA